MTDVVLHVGGKKYAGWKTARVTRGIETVSGSFALSVSERWANQSQAWPIQDGDECSVSINGETLITGFVDDRNPSFGPAEHRVDVEGRDKTCDLVDSSAFPDGPFEFKGFTIKQLAEKLCVPHGIKVSIQSGVTLPSAPKKVSISPGDTCFAVLEHYCRLAGVLPVSDGKGGLVLARAGSSRCTTALIEGKNLLSGSAKFSSKNRFHKYIARGQHAASDDFFGEQAAAVKGTAEDPNVSRANRVLLVRPEGNVTIEFAKKRAEWEATTRAARSSEVSAVVQGWTQGDGKLWPVNALVSVKSPRLGVDGELLIVRASYEVSDSGGTTTTLSLKPPNAFKPEPQGVSKDGLWKEIARGV